MSKKVGWIIFISSTLLYAGMQFLNSSLESRKLQLSKYSEKILSELQYAKSNISTKAYSIKNDAAFNASVEKKYLNSVRSVLSSYLRKNSITNIGVHDQTCGTIAQNSINGKQSNICRKKGIGAFYWIKVDSIPTLALTLPISKNFLISIGMLADENWASSFLGPLDDISLKYSQPKFKNDYESLGAIISPHGINNPVIADNHFLAKNFAGIVHPHSKKHISMAPITILTLLSFLYLILCHLKEKADLQRMLLEYKSKIDAEANKLGVSTNNELGNIFAIWEKRFEETSCKTLEQTQIISALEKDLKSLKNELADQTRVEAVNLQILRSLNALCNNLESQRDGLDTIDSLLTFTAKKNLSHIRQITADWQFQIDMKGPRKFLRGGFEVESSTDSNTSKFEAEINNVITQTGNLEGGLIAIIKELRSLEEKGRWTRKIINYWSSLLNDSEGQNQKISASIHQAISQVRLIKTTKFSVETPSWTEPLITSQAPSSIMTCVIIESLTGMISEHNNQILIHYRSGSMRDQLILTKLSGKTIFSKDDFKNLQASIDNANSFGKSYGLNIQILAGTDDHISLSISWSVSSVASRPSPREKTHNEIDV